METGWDERPHAQSPAGNFLRLKDKDTAWVTLLGEPVKFRKHWDKVSQRSTICTKRETGECDICDDPYLEREEKFAPMRFAIPVYVHYTKAAGQKDNNPVAEVQTFEQSGRTYDTLLAVVQVLEDNWNKQVIVIKRDGSDMSTRYNVVPTGKEVALPDGLEVPDLAAFYTEQMGSQKSPPTDPPPVSDDSAPDYGDPFNDQ